MGEVVPFDGGETWADDEGRIHDGPRPRVATFDPWATLPPETLTEEPPARRWTLHCNGDGVLARGIVGLLVAPGGRGKSMALLQLAIAIALGKPWLSRWQVAEPGRVVVLLGEEDALEVHRRLYAIAGALGLTAAERMEAASRIVALGLAGRDVCLATEPAAGLVAPTPAYDELRDRLRGDEHACVILDPLSAFLPMAELSNPGATGSVRLLEALSSGPGEPSVIVAQHTPKWSRREGNKADSSASRGVTGLTDRARWVANLSGKSEEDLTLAISKINGTKYPEPIALVRGAGGTLFAASEADMAERRAEEERATQALRDAILTALYDRPGLGARALREAAGRASKTRSSAVDMALRDMLRLGEVVNDGTASRPQYVVSTTEKLDLAERVPTCPNVSGTHPAGRRECVPGSPPEGGSGTRSPLRASDTFAEGDGVPENGTRSDDEWRDDRW